MSKTWGVWEHSFFQPSRWQGGHWSSWSKALGLGLKTSVACCTLRFWIPNACYAPLPDVAKTTPPACSVTMLVYQCLVSFTYGWPVAPHTFTFACARCPMKDGCLLRQKPYMSAGPKGQASHFQGATCVTFAERYEKHWKALSQPPVCILSCLWRSGCTGSWVYPKPERADCLFW